MAMFSDKDADFDTEVQERVPYLDANDARLTIDATRKTRMDNAFAAWNISWPAAESDTSDSSTAIDQKNIDRTELEASIRDIIDNIPEGLFTTADRHVLNHPVRDAEPTAVVIKDYPPRIVVEKNNPGVTTLRITDPQNPHTQEMPNGQKVLLAVFKGARGATTIQTLTFVDVELVTRFLKVLNFDPADVGTWAYVRGCYVNNRGQKGVWSTLVSWLIN